MSQEARPRLFFNSLESLRGIAALSVALLHIGWYNPVTTAGYFVNAYLMVDFFFVLSGFVICHSYFSKINSVADTKKFMWLRLGRLYPLHLTMLLVWVGIEGLRFLGSTLLDIPTTEAIGKSNTIYTFISSLFLMQSMGLHWAISWNAPSWSISTEMFAYLFFALAVLGLKTRRRLGIAAVFVIAISIYILTYARYPGLMASTKLGYFRCLAGFMTGVLTYNAFLALLARNDKDWINQLGAAASLLAVIVFLSLKTKGTWADLYLLPMVASTIFFTARSKGGPLLAILNTKPLSWLGKVSYSIYMVHTAVIWFVTQYIRQLTDIPVAEIGGKAMLDPGTPLGIALVLITVAAICIVSHFTFTYIEDPFRQKSRELAKRWFPTSGATAPANTALPADTARS